MRWGRGAVAVALTDEPGVYSLTAQNMVGTLVVDDLRILIRPKIRPENLFLLLEVGLPSKAWRQESFEYTTSTDLLPSIIAFFARTLANTLARGLLRSYRPEEERLIALRGRIDVASQFRQAGAPLPVACRYDEYTPDIFENRYAKAAARLAVRVPGVKAEDRRRLLQQLAALEEVLDAPVRADDLDRLPFTRLNAHYKPALRLARLLLSNLTLVDQRGDRSASSFLVDMNQLFEDFVTQRLRRALRGRLEVRSQSPVHLGVGRKVPMRPDPCIPSAGHRRVGCRHQVQTDLRCESPRERLLPASRLHDCSRSTRRRSYLLPRRRWPPRTYRRSPPRRQTPSHARDRPLRSTRQRGQCHQRDGRLVRVPSGFSCRDPTACSGQESQTGNCTAVSASDAICTVAVTKAQAWTVRTLNPSVRAASISASLRSASARHISASITRAAAIASSDNRFSRNPPDSSSAIGHPNVRNDTISMSAGSRTTDAIAAEAAAGASPDRRRDIEPTTVESVTARHIR